MSIIFGYILILLIVRVIFFNAKQNKYFLIIAALFLFLIATFRSFEFGTDLAIYIPRYENMKYLNYKDVIDNSLYGNQKDLAFYLFSKFLSNFNFSSRGYISVLSLIFLMSFFKTVNLYSPLPLLSIVSFLSLGYFSFSLTGLRQSIALAFILFSYQYFKENKIFRFIITVVIGSLFHSSALIFLIVYPFSKIKGIPRRPLILTLAILITLFFEGILRNFISIMSWNESLGNYATQTVSLSFAGAFIQIMIYLFCLYYKKDVLKLNSKNIILYDLLALGIVFQIFSTIVAEFFRISMYFSIFSIILIPLAIKSEKNPILKIAIYFYIFIFLVLYIVWSGDFADFSISL